MAVRLYPDFVVAVELKDGLMRRFRFACHGSNSPIIKEDVEKAVDGIYLSSKGICERQDSLREEGVPNVFLGYGLRRWTAADYEGYFERSPFFVPDEYPWLYKIAPAVADLYRDGDTVKTFVKRLTGAVLTMRYSEELKEKYGI